MPLPVAIPIGLLVGLSLAWIARGELARSEVALVLARPFLVAVTFGAAVFAPIAGYFAARHGDWAYLYLIAWSRVPSAADLVFVLIAGACVPVAFAGAAPFAVEKRGSLLAKVAAAIVAVTVALVVVFARRLGVSATYAQYHGGFGATPIAHSPLGRSLLVSWVCLAAAYGWTANVLRGSRAK